MLGTVQTAPAGDQPDPGAARSRSAWPAGHAVELPRSDGHAQDRAGAGGGVHRGAQAGQRHPADRARDRRDCCRRPGCRPASSTCCPHGGPVRWCRRCWPARRCASCRSPGPPRSADPAAARPPTGCSAARWSSVATRRSWCSPTPTSTPRWPERWSRRCATAERPAPRPTGSTSTHRSPTSSPRGSPRRWPSCGSARGSTTSTQLGPLINPAAVDTVDRLVTDAVDRGARRP